jgi:hypothetical protein
MTSAKPPKAMRLRMNKAAATKEPVMTLTPNYYWGVADNWLINGYLIRAADWPATGPRADPEAANDLASLVHWY